MPDAWEAQKVTSECGEEESYKAILSFAKSVPGGYGHFSTTYFLDRDVKR